MDSCLIKYTKRVAETDRAALLSFSGLQAWVPKKYISKKGKYVLCPDWFAAKIGLNPENFKRWKTCHHIPKSIEKEPEIDQALYRPEKGNPKT